MFIGLLAVGSLRAGHYKAVELLVVTPTCFVIVGDEPHPMGNGQSNEAVDGEEPGPTQIPSPAVLGGFGRGRCLSRDCG